MEMRVRRDTLAQIAETKRTQAEFAAQQQSLQQQQQELQQQVAQAEIKRYAAIGRLAPSSLQANGQSLYRLIDPANGRTIVYVRAAAGRPVAAALNQFVAINGQVVKDEAMRITYVQPESYETVDPKTVNKKVFADYAPPSLATANLASGDAAGN